jgi:hypothetical protein
VAGPAEAIVRTLSRVATLGANGHERRTHHLDFDDWIYAQLASSPQPAQGRGAAGRLKRPAAQARPARLLQAFTACAAVALFAVGLMVGAPVPAMQILPAQRPQSLPVTSLGVASAAETPAATVTPAATARPTTHRRVERRPGAMPHMYYTAQSRTGATGSPSPRQTRFGTLTSGSEPASIG